MAEGNRPGGLTALAVLNFVGAAGCALFGLITLVAIAFLKNVKIGEGEDAERSMVQIEEAGGIAWLWIAVLMYAVSCVLLLISGIGYLKQRRVMGRRVGTVYAVISLLGSVIYIVAVGMKFEMLIGFVYPVLTLILINTTFKDDLVN